MHKNFVGDYAEICKFSVIFFSVELKLLVEILLAGWGMIDSNSRNVTTILQSVTVCLLRARIN